MQARLALHGDDLGRQRVAVGRWIRTASETAPSIPSTSMRSRRDGSPARSGGTDRRAERRARRRARRRGSRSVQGRCHRVVTQRLRQRVDAARTRARAGRSARRSGTVRPRRCNRRLRLGVLRRPDGRSVASCASRRRRDAVVRVEADDQVLVGRREGAARTTGPSRRRRHRRASRRGSTRPLRGELDDVGGHLLDHAPSVLTDVGRGGDEASARVRRGRAGRLAPGAGRVLEAGAVPLVEARPAFRLGVLLRRRRSADRPIGSGRGADAIGARDIGTASDRPRRSAAPTGRA